MKKKLDSGRRHTAQPNVRVLPLAAVEKALGEPAAKWVARCAEIATRVVQAGLVPDGTPVYGHWLGPVAPGSPFVPGMPFQRHGWISLPDGSVVDPTRWVFEGVKPYIYQGKADHYDEGGEKLRALRLPPPPGFDPDDKIFEVSQAVMPSTVWVFVEKILEIDLVEQLPGTLTLHQLHWLANLSLERLGAHAAGVYAALAKLDLLGFIPIDNRLRVQDGRWRPHA